MSRFSRSALLVLLAACAGGGSGSGLPTGPIIPPTVSHDPTGWVSAADGTIPLILLAPHGGDLSPSELPTRSCDGCVTGNDTNTQELLLAISNAFNARIGARPFIVINRLRRSKFDANRDRAEATDSYAPLDTMWYLWHARIDSAKARATQIHPRALVLDLHGHAHAIARIELGYQISATHLRENDALLATRLGTSSIARLDSVALAGTPGAAMLRGATALGSRIAALGYPSVPSAADSAPLVGESYFSGGYNTGRHGSAAGGAVDAIQLEHYYTGIRDTGANRAAYAEALVTALLAFLDDHYGWSPPE